MNVLQEFAGEKTIKRFVTKPKKWAGNILETALGRWVIQIG